jgi:hypothetical protein
MKWYLGLWIGKLSDLLVHLFFEISLLAISLPTIPVTPKIMATLFAAASVPLLDFFIKKIIPTLYLSLKYNLYYFLIYLLK